MGGAVSAGENNEDLVDNLKQANYIKSRRVEKVFRAIDRADYYLDGHKDNAYKDLAWKSGHLHLSAPCIYSEVMENLDLKPGLSFLNIGSGTGYLSTMAGLILGPHGLNHGVEIYEDVIEYAEERLENFRRKCPSFDDFDCAIPRFICGNGLSIESANGEYPQYDRVYCGAAVPPDRESYMKNMLRVKGVLVMPLSDQLMRIERTSETEWDSVSILPVSFASLIVPAGDQKISPAILPVVDPLSLQELCRALIRPRVRERVNQDFPRSRVKKRKIFGRKKQRKTQSKGALSRGCLSLNMSSSSRSSQHSNPNPSSAATSQGNSDVASSSSFARHHNPLRIGAAGGGQGGGGGGGGGLFTVAPRAMINFMLFNHSRHAFDGEEEEEDEQEDLEADQEAVATMDSSPPTDDHANNNNNNNDMIEVNNNSDNNNNSAVDLNNGAMNPEAAIEEDAIEDAPQPLPQSQRQTAENIQFRVTPPADAASILTSHCVNDDDIVIGGDIDVDDPHGEATDGAVQIGATSVNGKSSKISRFSTSPSPYPRFASSSSSMATSSVMDSLSVSPKRSTTESQPIRGVGATARGTPAVAVTRKDSDSFAPSSFDSGISDGSFVGRESLSSLGSTPGSWNASTAHPHPYMRVNSRRSRNSSSRLSETSDHAESICEEDEFRHWDFEEGSMGLASQPNKSNEMTTYVRCSSANGDRVITAGPSPIAEEADVFLESEMSFASSGSSCIPPLCGPSCGSDAAFNQAGKSVSNDVHLHAEESNSGDAMESRPEIKRAPATSAAAVANSVSAETSSVGTTQKSATTPSDQNMVDADDSGIPTATTATTEMAEKAATTTTEMTEATTSLPMTTTTSDVASIEAVDDRRPTARGKRRCFETVLEECGIYHRDGSEYDDNNDDQNNDIDDDDDDDEDGCHKHFRSSNRRCRKFGAEDDDDDDDIDHDVNDVDDDDECGEHDGSRNVSDSDSDSSARLSPPTPTLSSADAVPGVNHFREYIQKLPLPPPLQAFLLYHRDV